MPEEHGKIKQDAGKGKNMIGVLTFYWADDYGALLQSYGIKTYLNRYQETVMIPYYPIVLRSRYRLIDYNEADRFCKKSYAFIKQIAKQILHRRFYSNLKAKRRMRSFRKNYLTDVRGHLSSPKEIYEFEEAMDTYVVGSDQVWNPEITEGLQEGYFCTFRTWKKEGSRYVAYAASIGSEYLEERFDRPISELLVNFDAISVREPSAIPYIGKLCKRNLQAVLDPVFLLEKEEWEALINTNKKKKKRYIAVYYTEYNPTMADYLRQLEQYTGLNILILAPRIRNLQWTENQAYAKGCGPLDFLELLYHADYVVTNSFHGIAMSVIFHKQFAAFPHSVRNARLSDILHMLHLEARMVCNGQHVEFIDEKIDWKRADEALKVAVKHSKEFIEREILK